jgi:hypothetical protein
VVEFDTSSAWLLTFLFYENSISPAPVMQSHLKPFYLSGEEAETK